MRAAQLVWAARRLADVLELENAALRAMDLPRAMMLLSAKADAIAGLTEVGELSPELAHWDISSAASRLDSLAKENRRLLERAIVAQQRVIGIVVRAASTAGVEPSYGAKGYLGHQNRPMALSTRA